MEVNPDGQRPEEIFPDQRRITQPRSRTDQSCRWCYLQFEMRYDNGLFIPNPYIQILFIPKNLFLP